MREVLNREELWTRVEHDRELLAALFSLFKRRSQHVLRQLQAHVMAQDAQACSQDAHQLAGMLANLSAASALPLAREMERRAGSGDLQNATVRCQELQDAVGQVTQALSSLLNEEPAESQTRSGQTPTQ